MDKLFNSVLELPKKLLRHHHVPGLVNLILCNLAHKDHFHLKKAVFVVDNPEFNCCKGVAGYCSSLILPSEQELWQDPEKQAQSLMSHEFNAKVKGITSHTLKFDSHDHLKPNEALQELIKKLELSSPKVVSWPLRHNNHGVLLYQPEDEEVFKEKDSLFQKAASLLGLSGF